MQDEAINIHYRTRYENFIKTIRLLGARNLDYSEKHHIIPKSLNGTNSKENIIQLTLREHHLAHWMLWKAYPYNNSLCFAFYAMCNKNINSYKNKYFKPISSKIYAKLKIKANEEISKLQFDKVRVYNNEGELLTLSKNDYKHSSYTFHTTGMMRVFSKLDQSEHYISCIEYYNHLDDYESPTKYFQYNWINLDTNETFKATKIDARKLKTNGMNIKQIQKSKIKTKSGKLLTPAEYKASDEDHILSGTIMAYDTINKKHIKITQEEYYNNKTRYITTTKGKVLAKDKNGNNCFITKEEYNNGEYVGQTKGLTTVYNTETNQYEQVSIKESKKEKYHGANKGKVCIYDVLSQTSYRISKDEYNKLKHIRYFGGGSETVKMKNPLTSEVIKCKIHNIDKYLSIGYILIKPLTKLQQKIYDLIK